MSSHAVYVTYRLPCPPQGIEGSWAAEVEVLLHLYIIHTVIYYTVAFWIHTLRANTITRINEHQCCRHSEAEAQPTSVNYSTLGVILFHYL